MSEFLEYDEVKKSIKVLNLDDFSVEDLNEYVHELENEISRVNLEIKKKNKLLSEAENFFK